MAIVIDEIREIDAPCDVTWEVISDLRNYDQWNPFIVLARSTLVVGDPIYMLIRLIDGTLQPQRDTIFEHVPGQRLRYGVPRDWLGALASNFQHELKDIGNGRTHYHMHLEISGWLAPLVRKLFIARLTGGLQAMTSAIQHRAEELRTAGQADRVTNGGLQPVGS
ncbi:MAG: SRPBCC family protein [Stenotrophobium sp.]